MTTLLQIILTLAPMAMIFLMLQAQINDLNNKLRRMQKL